MMLGTMIKRDRVFNPIMPTGKHTYSNTLCSEIYAVTDAWRPIKHIDVDCQSVCWVQVNVIFSSVFTREDTSSLPVPETKFEGSEGERLG